MKIYTLLAPIAIAILLTGCATKTPVVPKFPPIPAELLQQCPELRNVPENAQLSDVALVVVDNYTTYHLCKSKNDAFIEWYKSNKQIYESVLK